MSLFTITAAGREAAEHLGGPIEFRSRIETITGQSGVRAALVMEAEPADASLWTTVCHSVDVHLTWPGNLAQRLAL